MEQADHLAHACATCILGLLTRALHNGTRPALFRIYDTKTRHIIVTCFGGHKRVMIALVAYSELE